MNNIQLETTPRVYYEYYYTTPNSLDFYPSLSRRIGNGETFILKPSIKKPQQANFIILGDDQRLRHYNEDEDPLWRPQRQQVPWDLYPSVLRNVIILLHTDTTGTFLIRMIFLGGELRYRANATKTSYYYDKCNCELKYTTFDLFTKFLFSSIS